MNTMKVHPSYATGIYLASTNEEEIPVQINAVHAHNDKPLGVFNIFEVSYGENVYGDTVPFYVMYKHDNSDEIIRLELQHFICDEVEEVDEATELGIMSSLDYIRNNVTNNQWARISGLMHANKFTADMRHKILDMISQNLNNNSLEQYICHIWIGGE